MEAPTNDPVSNWKVSEVMALITRVQELEGATRRLCHHLAGLMLMYRQDLSDIARTTIERDLDEAFALVEAKLSIPPEPPM